jgi:Family of unknown function (DUF5716)
MDASRQIPALFDLLPDGIFAPLTAPNKRHYWRLLYQLFEDRFGPDAPLPPSVGFQRREIVSDLEGYLLTDDPWETEEGETPNTPLNTRANNIYERFRIAGWLRQERIGAREMVSMPPLINRLLGTLTEFIEQGPTFLGAKMRSIELQLRQVVDGQAGGDTLDEAADQARQLLSFVASTSVQVRDLMAELTQSESTAAFARALFERYVSRLFVGDYADLHSADHPLARRSAILSMLTEIEHSAIRDRLAVWYQTKLTAGDALRAEQRLQRSLRRLAEIDRIDEYLDRLDEDIRQANRRAIAYLDYRLRAPEKLDVLLTRACRAVQQAPASELRLPIAPGALMHEERLRPPRQAPSEIARSANEIRIPTPEQIARMALLQKMKRARLVLPEDLQRYVTRHLHADKIDSEELAIVSIADLRAFQTLLTLGMRSGVRSGLRAGDPLRNLQKGFRVELIATQRQTHAQLIAPRFVIHRQRGAA